MFRSDQVEADVRRLYPGECGQQSQTWYYVEKLSLSLALVFVGTAFAFLIDCREKKQSGPDQNGNSGKNQRGADTLSHSCH